MNAEQLAQLFHETYERLAPDFGYRTREASAKPWADVPESNRALMIATCDEVLEAIKRAAIPAVYPLLRAQWEAERGAASEWALWAARQAFDVAADGAEQMTVQRAEARDEQED